MVRICVSLSLSNSLLHDGGTNNGAVFLCSARQIAIHSLIYFYLGTKHLLKPLKPVWKFLSIKAIIFFAFW